MQRDPNFKKNQKRFHGMPSQATRSNGPVSTVNKLDRFIQWWSEWTNAILLTACRKSTVTRSYTMGDSYLAAAVNCPRSVSTLWKLSRERYCEKVLLLLPKCDLKELVRSKKTPRLQSTRFPHFTDTLVTSFIKASMTDKLIILRSFTMKNLATILISKARLSWGDISGVSASFCSLYYKDLGWFWYFIFQKLPCYRRLCIIAFRSHWEKE